MSKPLPTISQADRARVRKALVKAYNTGHTTSGEVRVTSLGFSSNPHKWHISAETVNGTPYYGELGSRANVHISAILSGDWLEKPLPDLIHRIEETRQHDIIAGIHEITPPPDITKAELLVLSGGHRGLRLETRYGFRFTLGDLTAVVSTNLTRYPSQTKLAATVAAKEFRQLVAQHVARRMLPKPKDGLTYKSVARWAMDMIDDINKGLIKISDGADATRSAIKQLAKILPPPLP